MNILYVAPLPPPITGHSIVAQALLRYLQCRYSVKVIDLSKGSHHDGAVTMVRIVVVLRMIFNVMVAARHADRLYLTISESVAGNLKDLFLYIVIGKLAKDTVIHLHGGSFRIQVLERSFILRKLNQFYLSKLGAAVVSGPSHANIFDGLVPADRIYTVPNFAQDFMFVKLEKIERKFINFDRGIRVLYVSGMTAGKGYLRLLEAYEMLSDAVRSCVQIDFAGKFDCEIEHKQFLDRISTQAGVAYHGVISDREKFRLFSEAHIFCLPTRFQEGQPISIIEAYASGCVVLSTPRPGILDIFDPLKNGFVISSEDPSLLKEILEKNCFDLLGLRIIAMHNRQVAETMFRELSFCRSVESVILNGVK